MISNEDLQKSIQDALKWEPLLHAAEIGVTAKDGVVTLTGTVDNYTKKLQAEDAAKKITGVKALVEKIEIQLGHGQKLNDNEIASEVLSALKWNWEIPSHKIKIMVEKGWITLEGELEWKYQKDAAQKVVRNLSGVKGVVNNISIRSAIHDKVDKKEIEGALERNWSIDKKNIEVIIDKNSVFLHGKVRSWYEKEEAERIAWNAPGVWDVKNELVIEFSHN